MAQCLMFTAFDDFEIIRREMQQGTPALIFNTHAEREIHVDAPATARKVSTKQSATAATVRVSGDQQFPGPSNSAGGADTSGVRREDVISARPFSSAVTVTLYW